MPNTVKLHRVLAAKPEKVYRAFLEADAMTKWISPDGFTCTVHHMEPKVGGTFRMSFRNFTTGISHAFGGEYLELVANERLRYTDRFEDPTCRAHQDVMIVDAEHAPAKDPLDLPPTELKNLIRGIIWRDEHFDGLTVREIAERESFSEAFIGRCIFRSLEL